MTNTIVLHKLAAEATTEQINSFYPECPQTRSNVPTSGKDTQAK